MNSALKPWIELFPDAAMENAALDRLVSQSYAIILEDESYRRQLSPKKTPLQKEGDIMQKTV